jgi:hypothetical protein
MSPQPQELGVYIGRCCLACCYGSQASQWKKLEESAPALCGTYSTYVCPLENRDRDSNRTWLTWARPDWGIRNKLLSLATITLDLNCLKALCMLGLELTQPKRSLFNCSASTVMNSACHAEHMMSRNDNRHARQEWSYLESLSSVDLIWLVL